MDEELEKLYLQNIEEYIFDEDKIVTYKWLSKTLNIHVNTAKQLLYTFTTEIESDRKPELQLTYLVGGLLPDGKGCKFQVVREDDLLKLKNQFKVVTSEHIYSIHKSKRLPDLNILYGIDCIKETEDGGTMQGTIHCKKSVRRLEEQLAELRLQSRAASLCGNGKLIPQVTKNSTAKQKPKPEEPAQPKEKPSLFTTISSKPKPEDKVSEPVKPAPDTKKNKSSGSIASMFSAQSNKAKKTESSEQKKVATPMDTAQDTSSKSKEASSIVNMFANQASKPKPKTEAKKPVEREADIVPKAEDIKKEVEEEKPTAKRKHQSSGKTKVASKGKSKKLKSAGSEPAKKRKRIRMGDDSDSSDDDIFGKEEDEMEEEDNRDMEPEPSDVEEIIPATPQQETHKGRKRKRKLVDRTFESEDGYICTKKEFVFESCSGSEGEEGDEKENDKVHEKENDKAQEKDGNDKPMEEVKPTKEPGPVKSETSTKPSKGKKKSSSPKKKPPPPQKGKQMTLTSFFKKN